MIKGRPVYKVNGLYDLPANALKVANREDKQL